MELVEGLARIDDLDTFVDRLAAVGDEHGVAVLALSARYVTGRQHLERAVALANRAVSRGEAIADDRALEICCYAAGRRQIERALELTVEAGESETVVVIDAGPDPDGDPAERERAAAGAVAELLEQTPTLGGFDEPTVREYFDVSDTELAATTAGLPALVRERVALLAVDR